MSRNRNSTSTPSKNQATLSSFFSQTSPRKDDRPTGNAHKRPNSPIDLTVDSDNEVPRKRARTTSTFFESTAGPSTQGREAGSSASGGVAEQWRFNPAVPSAPNSSGAPDEEEQRRRRDKAKRILLGEHNFFLRNESNDREPGRADGSSEVEGKGEEAATSGNESDEQFSELMKMFANSKSKKGAKGSKKTASTQAAPRTRKRKDEEIGPSGQPYTPFELQVRELKAKHPGVLLMVQAGYKLTFFEEDAKIASQELGIVCFLKRNLFTAMIPLHRKHVHLKKLLSQGYKVGIVEQTETAALKKVGDNRNELFDRELTHLYTAATYVDELNSTDDLDPTSPPPLMCLVEQPMGGMGTDERVSIAMIAISPSTGDVVWDIFEDNHMRTELETRMVHTKPYELLLPEDKLSQPSEKMIKYFTEHTHMDHKVRIERLKKELSFTQAFSLLSKFYTDKTRSAVSSETFKSGKLMAAVADFPKGCLAGDEVLAKFTQRTHMLLNANTLTNLEIYQNGTDFTIKGSLMWILDHTSTKFGARLLRSWVGRPLIDLKVLQERTDAVEEILADISPKLAMLRDLLKRLPDLAKGLCRIQYGKCTPQELAVLLSAFKKVADTFNTVEGTPDTFRSSILNDVVTTLPRLKGPINGLINDISLKMASDAKKESLWTDPDKYPDIDALAASIQVVESELTDELKSIRKILKKPALKYSTWRDEEYVIEVMRNENREIPPTWSLLSSTKQLRRYHPPAVKTKLQQRAQWKEALDAAANKAFLCFLQEITQNHYGILRDSVNKLATADCLLSLALVAVQEGYVKPDFTEDDTLEIVAGRHAMIEALRSEPFVPNSIHMGGGKPGSKIITGPNMGGKSSVVRMIALCAIMSQVGSYVPAKYMKTRLLDGILTRMGASDDLARGRSTFMVEMQETSDILQMATSKTLVILDELGRGTSTFDGMAIAGAVLQHLIQVVKCKTLFITHYPQVATELERKFPSDVENLHMGFTEDTRVDGTREVTFLYRLAAGITAESFGVECARLAGLPESVLRTASDEAQRMKALIEARNPQMCQAAPSVSGFFSHWTSTQARRAPSNGRIDGNI
ncbi:DNA mismatch repair protein MSH3 [Grifola frondosa]|uniref:DNA mismatch repair protein MSH3 n=1 Tax=Grifola frondosa TaxID=5627 RepID=A0A1C7MER8_GRIFR|nr:DNA mismatch repair protein MSH3 [Grifola frondosa]